MDSAQFQAAEKTQLDRTIKSWIRHQKGKSVGAFLYTSPSRQKVHFSHQLIRGKVAAGEKVKVNGFTMGKSQGNSSAAIEDETPRHS